MRFGRQRRSEGLVNRLQPVKYQSLQFSTRIYHRCGGFFLRRKTAENPNRFDKTRMRFGRQRRSEGLVNRLQPVKYQSLQFSTPNHHRCGGFFLHRKTAENPTLFAHVTELREGLSISLSGRLCLIKQSPDHSRGFVNVNRLICAYRDSRKRNTVC
jgi:hypothetical protein